MLAKLAEGIGYTQLEPQWTHGTFKSLRCPIN
jgi:hypothetical protein